MKIIGLAGGSGCGKSTVCTLFKKFNFASIDTDIVYHELTSVPNSPCLVSLQNEFGDIVISSSGVLDRRALARIVFSEGAAEKREKLNKIAHKFVLDEVRRRISGLKEQGYAAVLVDAPLLFESGFHKECDIILCVIAKKDTRIRRIIARDGITDKMAEERISAQMTDEALIEKSDWVIINDGSISELEDQVETAAVKILNNN